ncbi:hypothetical protein K7X08_007545 [Anisodus acutangulus]|uniref:Uncharacterized protein n=1 Tax=Anisodus acutangulus TaxID=402998 RepID=A0A9Q1LDA1_9SOLA|nr:hypothetical protein K7X08_007545 [Anisodus acutangulus]
MHREIESNVRCYEPLVVSIGPFHHGKPKLQFMEKYKELLAIQFADQDSNEPRPEGVLPWRSTNSVSIHELYRKVKNIVPNVRECSADELVKDYSDEELKMKSHDIAFIRRDLFLLENQLPLEVLQVLMSSLLTLPPITTDDSTKSEFLNLVAYEACPDTPDDFGVTSYICFMESLIDHAEDVKELRSKGVLLNFLGSDQEVADLFNEIARDLVPNPHAFVDVKNKIEDHYKNRGKIWIAEWKNAAIFVIGLQVADTSEYD